MLPEDDWLLYMDGNTAIHRYMSVDVLLGSSPRIIASLLGEGPPIPAKGFMVWRNTEGNRNLLLQLDILKGHEFSRASTGSDEADLLRESGLLAVHEKRSGRVVATRGRVVNWQKLDAFAVCFEKVPHDKYSHHYCEDKPYRDFAVSRINQANVSGTDVFDNSTAYKNNDNKYKSLNAKSPIAIITLYTPNIDCYGQINEENVDRYCLRHNIAHHVYRDIPADVPADVSGTWMKANLLQRHFDDYDWVIWVDADMLFIDQSQSLLDRLEGRDILVARDIGEWSFNAGFLAFKTTTNNKRILREISAILELAPDRSTTYVNGGDQLIWNKYFEENKMVNDANVCDYLTVNTHFCFSDRNTFLAHFMGLGEPTRSCMMEDFERMSLELYG
ncbi:MAG: hypothetical protein Q8K99_07215 [Actinomycetota bacterium]|nr:hypothetical protein [Actinomycetota bacterium]